MGSPQELIFGLGVLYDFLDKGKSQNHVARSNLKQWKVTYIDAKGR
jgi:hypothetical protein